MRAVVHFRQAWACVLVAVGSAWTQTAPPRSQFKTSLLVSGLSDPTTFAFLPDGRVLLAGIKGAVRLVDPVTGDNRAAGTIPTTNVHEDGLHGLVLDPGYADNHFLYALFGTQQPEAAMVVARFATRTDHTLDPATRKDLLTVPSIFGSQEEHTTGSLAFGPDGLLFIGLADNTRNIFSGLAAGYAPRDPSREVYDAQRSAANSNDLRGKILRIQPTADGGYTVPEGNLFPEGTEKARPEIYAMGLRHPYRITVDPKTGWLFWAEPGPNAGQDNANLGVRGYDEVNLAKDPGNYGWPYCLANNFCNTKLDYATGLGSGTYDPAALVNASKNNTGIAELPPARPALVWYPYNAAGTAFPVFGSGGTNAAMLGPVYRYDAANPSAAKLPAYYDGKLFIFDFMRSLVHAVSVDGDGKLLGVERFWDPSTDSPIQNPIDCKLGPDGALYFLNWSDNGSYPHNAGNGNLVKLEYTGPHDPVGLGGRDRDAANGPAESLDPSLIWSLLGPGQAWSPPRGETRASAEAYDPQGRRVWAWSGGAAPRSDSRLLRVRLKTDR